MSAAENEFEFDPGTEPKPAPGARKPRGAASDGGAFPEGPDETAALIDDLARQNDTLRAERDEARDAHKRALADHQNAHRRALANEQTAKEMGVRGVLLSVLPVIDNFDMAMLSDPSKVSAQQVMDGVGLIKAEMLRALSGHGATLINPKPGDVFDPQRHEAIMHQPAEGIAPNHIVNTLRVGFEIGGRLVRPAQVSVAPAA
ncbi:nucleotide exchange factor GrpE [soil metagenome]